MKTFFLVLIIIIGVIGIIAGFIFQKFSVSTALKASSIKSALVNATPTPLPFRELTIPYLRERTFESKLGELTLVNSAGTYSSYLTSYDSDGVKVNGLLTQPTGEMPDGGWPAVVFIHGYIPPRQYNTLGPQYADYVDYLARNGFVVFKIDLRGHGESEGQAGGGYYGSDYVIDTLNAYAALQSADFVNPNKIGLWGHSMAGNAVMRAVAAEKDIPAAVIWAGAVYTYIDFREYGIQDASYVPPQPSTTTPNRRQRIVDTVGEITADNPFWKEVAPTNFLDEVTTAIELHHAVNDETVSIEYSRNLASILDKTGNEYELHEYQYGGHNISGGDFVTAMQRTVEFYRNM